MEKTRKTESHLQNHKSRILVLHKLVFYSLALCLILSKKAYAYLDPGTGSYLIQLLLAAFLGIGIGFRLFWGKIKVTIKKLFSKKHRLEKDQ